MQTIGETNAVILARFRKLFASNRRQADQHQCKECGKSVASKTELREHEKTCIASSEQQRMRFGMDSSEVDRKAFSR